MNSCIDFEAKDLYDGVRRSDTGVSISGHRTEIGQPVCRGADRRSWLIGSLPALFFSAAYLAAPAMTATIVVWSNGLTLSLPWLLYAGALLLFGVTVTYNLRGGRRTVAWALLLIAAAGYAPQLSSQFWFGVIGLWLLMEDGS